MKNNLLVTHARPHIDDVAAVWLLKTYHPDFADAAIEFLQKGDSEPVIPEGAVAIGIGRGQFDEHKGDKGESATSLVWKWLREQPEVNLDPKQKLAVERLVSWVHREDLAELKMYPMWEWSVTIPVEYAFDTYDGDNHRVYDLATRIFEVVIGYYEKVAQLDVDWDSRIEFESKWGKAIALESPASGLSERAWQQGAVMVIQINPGMGTRQFRAKMDSPADFSEIYEKVRSLEPQASWFLHHEKRLLLCGSRTASTFNPSKLTLQDMIDLVKK